MTAIDASLPHQFHDLYTDHHGWLVHWLRRRLGCTHGAADLAQDTFLRLLGTSDLPGILEPRAYLTTTANRLLIDRVRRQRIELTYLAELAHATETLESHPSPEQILLAVEALNQLCLALDGMAEKPRQAFLSHYLDGQTHAAVAAQLGVSTKMVQKYLAKALVHCHQMLAT